MGEAGKIYKKAVSEASPGDGEMVLLVEDEPAIRKMCEIMLKKLGYQVLSAGTPEEALQIAGKYTDKISLLITDVVMPGMNGRELAHQLLTVHSKIKTLFMSGYTADAIAQRGVLEKKVQFIQKPFSIKDLGLKIGETLNKSK
jgi:DNA-binding NtrC family response regulator